MFLCRRATDAEFGFLCSLRVDMLREEFQMPSELDVEIIANTARFFRNGTRDGTVIPLVAAKGEEIAGMCAISFFTLPPTDWCLEGTSAYLGNMYVRPEYRRKGVATSLMNMALTEAKRRGCERILLHTSDEGRPLYEKFGFESSDTEMVLFPPA